MARSPTTVVIADADRLAADIVGRACTEQGVAVIGQTTDGRRVRQLCAAFHPDVAVLGDRVDGEDLESLLDQIAGQGVRILLLAREAGPDRLLSLLAAGADGCLDLDASPEEVACGVVAIADGGAPIEPTAASVILQQWRRLRSEPVALPSTRSRSLTPREQDVLKAMAEGLAAKGIARRLGVATKTVENHKVRVFDKLGVRNHAQAVSVAITHGLIPVEGRAPVAANGYGDGGPTS